jgi:uncharacterized membrane protein YciS (DUF1049 family)
VNILIYLVVAVFFITLFLVGVYNSGDVTVNLLLWQLGPTPMGAIIAAAAIFGVAFACAIGVLDGIKIRITNRQLRRQIQRLEEEADGLRLRLARHEGPREAGGPGRPEGGDVTS